MAGQLGDLGAELRIQQPQQSVDTDLLQMSLAAPLPVELREMAHVGAPAHRDPDVVRPRPHVGQDARVPMHIVVRVHVRRRRADELGEAAELTLELSGHVRRPIRIELEMQADAQGGAGAGHGGGLHARGPVHHQARAREDAVAMRRDDPTVDAAADAEVVGGDDEQLRTGGHSAKGGRSARNQGSKSISSPMPHSAPSCSSAIAAQTTQWA